MLTKRLIACFDIVKDRVTKARKFEDNIDIADAVSLAKKFYDEQIDEIIFYDIKASVEKRKIDLKTVRRVARETFVPFTVGGGIKSLDDMHEVLKAGAEKISIDSMAVRNPQIIKEGAKAFGRQCMVLSMQVKKNPSKKFPSGYEIKLDGGRVATGLDAVKWAQKGEELGAGEIVVNSIDNDGTHNGYDLTITKKIANLVTIPVIASGGAGTISHLEQAFHQTKVSAGIISSMLYSPRLAANFTVKEIKEKLLKSNIAIRPYFA